MPRLQNASLCARNVCDVERFGPARRIEGSWLADEGAGLHRGERLRYDRALGIPRTYVASPPLARRSRSTWVLV